MQSHKKTGPSRLGGRQPQPSKPTIGSQVVIQSVQEKQLKKIFRKEDRRLARQQAKEGHQQNEDHLKNFDPAEMKRMR